MALPPSAYQQWKASAPDVAVIEVLSTNTESGTTETEGTSVQLRRTHIVVDAEAQVLSVERTAGALSAGATIHIRYTHRPLRAERMENGEWKPTQMVGASPIPLLEKGDKVTAWLRATSDGAYEPAAEAESFAVVVAPPEPATKTD